MSLAAKSLPVTPIYGGAALRDSLPVSTGGSYRAPQRLTHPMHLSLPVLTLGELPSSESVQAVLNRQPGGWLKVLASTALRAILVAPGVYVAGARGTKLALGSLVASASITTFIFIYYGAMRRSEPA